MIDNFEQLDKICKWEKGQYYKFVALVRAKDYDEINLPVLKIKEGGELFVKQWFIDSKEKLEKYKPDMIALCNALKCRLYMTTDIKSTLKTILLMSQQLNEFLITAVQNYDSFSLRKLSKFSASASQKAEVSVHEKRKWLIDFDLKNVKNIGEALGLISKTQAVLDKYNQVLLNTPNGYHIVCDRKMDIGTFLPKHLGEELPEYVELKENALTLVYYGGIK